MISDTSDSLLKCETRFPTCRISFGNPENDDISNLSTNPSSLRGVKQSASTHRERFALHRTPHPLSTPYNDDSCKILRHCERSEAIHACTLDCFVPRNDEASFPSSSRGVKQSALPSKNALLRTSHPFATPYNDGSCKTLRHCERSEAIHARTLDCFIPRKDAASFPSSLRDTKQSASTLKERFASYLATPYNDGSCKTLRHCERSEAIHARTPDCFIPRNDEASFPSSSRGKKQSASIRRECFAVPQRKMTIHKNSIIQSTIMFHFEKQSL
jgi:hypothetical protein